MIRFKIIHNMNFKTTQNCKRGAAFKDTLAIQLTIKKTHKVISFLTGIDKSF